MKRFIFLFMLLAGIHFSCRSQDSIPEKKYEGIPYRYFIGNTSFDLPPGHGYYANTWLLGNEERIGLDEHLSVGGGIIAGFVIIGIITPVWVNVKFHQRVTDRFYVSAGGSYTGIFAIGWVEDFTFSYGHFAMASAGFTWGDYDNNFSLNVYKAFPISLFEDEDEEGTAVNGNAWVFNPALKFKISPKTHLVLENFVLTENILSLKEFQPVWLTGIYGIQTAFKKSVWEFGIMGYYQTPFENYSGHFLVLPYLGLKKLI